jgi:hypothetical protein
MKHHCGVNRNGIVLDLRRNDPQWLENLWAPSRDDMAQERVVTAGLIG